MLVFLWILIYIYIFINELCFVNRCKVEVSTIGMVEKAFEV